MAGDMGDLLDLFREGWRVVGLWRRPLGRSYWRLGYPGLVEERMVRILEGWVVP